MYTFPMKLYCFISVHCRSLGNLPNGNINYNHNAANGQYPLNTQATFACNAGYRISGGSGTRTCTTYETWTGHNPTCIGIKHNRSTK